MNKPVKFMLIGGLLLALAAGIYCDYWNDWLGGWGCGRRHGLFDDMPNPEAPTLYWFIVSNLWVRVTLWVALMAGAMAVLAWFCKQREFWTPLSVEFKPAQTIRRYRMVRIIGGAICLVGFLAIAVDAQYHTIAESQKVIAWALFGAGVLLISSAWRGKTE